MDILKKAMTQAITLLISCGARYHIVEADGTEHGAPLVPEKKRIHRQRDPNAPRYIELIREKITPMQIGDVVVLRPQGFYLRRAFTQALLARHLRW